ncbi:carboxypeptidase regulatory-like domain-containing protein, partial [Micromonospora purpureochromogenes]
LVGTSQATHTDSAGRFRLTGVPDDPAQPGPVRLRLVGRGHALTADVDPADTDLVIVCEPPAR